MFRNTPLVIKTSSLFFSELVLFFGFFFDGNNLRTNIDVDGG